MITFWRNLEPLARRVLVIGLVVFVLVVAGGVHSCRSAWTAKTETRLATGQAGAAMASGADAASTVGEVAAKQAEADALTQENADAIRNAKGADSPVAAPVHDAGLRGLCRRPAYRGDPNCVQFAPAK
jgi:hypothetical protein